jgi:hypothetical protein
MSGEMRLWLPFTFLSSLLFAMTMTILGQEAGGGWKRRRYLYECTHKSISLLVLGRQRNQNELFIQSSHDSCVPEFTILARLICTEIRT